MDNAKVTVNDAAVRQLYAEIAEKIERADRDFRQTHEGYPVDVVTADARVMLESLGVNLPEVKLAEYAQAVSASEPFRWVLQ